MQILWQKQAKEEDWVLLLIDACNSDMLRSIRYYFPSGLRFAFNCYRYWAIIVVRDVGGGGHFLHKK